MHRMLSFAAMLLVAAVGCAEPPDAVTDADPAGDVAASSTADASAAEAEPQAQAGQTGTTQRPRLVAPVRGVAPVTYTKPVVKRGKQDGREMIVTTFQVKNSATAPIARFTVEEFWYDKAGNPVSGDRFVYPKPLQPNEVITVTLNTPVNPQMNSNSYKFSHANGDIKPTVAPKL